MSDIADDANKVADLQRNAALSNAKNQAKAFDTGASGECDNCGEYFPRVVARGALSYCGGCRDKLRLG